MISSKLSKKIQVPINHISQEIAVKIMKVYLIQLFSMPEYYSIVIAKIPIIISTNPANIVSSGIK
jgi:hypothetical protein